MVVTANISCIEHGSRRNISLRIKFIKILSLSCYAQLEINISASSLDIVVVRKARRNYTHAAMIGHKEQTFH
jgi:hypothetical protein